MLFKEPYAILAEAAKMDLKANTEGTMLEEDITSALDSFDEASYDIHISGEMVPVLTVDNKYVVEMESLHTFMRSNNITSVTEALNSISESNGLQEKQVGLLIESSDYFTSILEKAKCKDANTKNKLLGKVKKAVELPAKLKKDGFPVVKKKSCKEEGCKKEGCEEEGCCNKK